MKRATVTFPNDLEEALEFYLNDQEVPVTLTAAVQTAVREYLVDRGYLSPSAPLRVRAAKRGSGERDVSIDHDRYLANG